MQRYGNNQILYSPSDLVTFLGCHHASFLDVKALSEDMDKAEASTTDQLLQKKGLEYEAAYLQQLKDEGKSVIEISKDRNLQDRAKLTLVACLVQWDAAAGANVINGLTATSYTDAQGDIKTNLKLEPRYENAGEVIEKIVQANG